MQEVTFSLEKYTWKGFEVTALVQHAINFDGQMSKYYRLSECEVARVLGCSLTRVHNAVLREHKRFMPTLKRIGQSYYISSFDRVSYGGKAYSHLRTFEPVIKELATRRPYLNKARVALGLAEKLPA